MLFVFFVFAGIVLVLFRMTRVLEQRYDSLRVELIKTQDMLRSFEARLPVAVQDAVAVNADDLIDMAGPVAAKTDVFDSALDLHFDPEKEGR
jgi:hypothetical protein